MEHPSQIFQPDEPERGEPIGLGFLPIDDVRAEPVI